jgi:hypothetical protein
MERSAVGRRHERDKRRLSASQAVAPGGATVSLNVEQNGFEVLARAEPVDAKIDAGASCVRRRAQCA